MRPFSPVAKKVPDFRSMKSIRTLQWKYRVLLITIVLVILLDFSMVYLQNLQAQRLVLEEDTRASILSIKKDFLKDNVTNLIGLIDAKRQEQLALSHERQNRALGRLALFALHSSENFAETCILYFTGDDNQALFSVLLLSPDGTVLHRQNLPDDQLLLSPTGAPRLNPEHFPVHERRIYAGHTMDMGISQTTLDSVVQEQIATLIHQSRYSNDSYFWVNEIVDYRGGADYAIRRIHPNLPETEGMRLSTGMTDIMGNLPYLEELEGVREQGEIFFTYFFKKMNSAIISEKLTYSKLYKPYNWVVAMGIHLDDVQAYLVRSQQESRAHLRQMTLRMALLLAGICLAALLLMVWLERWYVRSTNRSWKTQTHVDPLTGAANRRAGMELLEAGYRRTKAGQSRLCLMMLDLDDFKKVNDTHGHPVGDEVLKQLTRLVQQRIRQTDTLCRWGGEEFMLFCEDLPAERCLPLAETLLEAIRSQPFGSADNSWHVTLSIGISWQSEADPDADAAVRRADQGLYEAKHSGKDKAVMIPPDVQR